MPKVGTLGLDMMLRTCAVQVSLLPLITILLQMAKYMTESPFTLNRLIWTSVLKLTWLGNSVLVLRYSL